MLQCVAVCCSALQFACVGMHICVAVCCSALQCVAVCVCEHACRISSTNHYRADITELTTYNVVYSVNSELTSEFTKLYTANSEMVPSTLDFA